jgi:uncharacterized protein
MPDTARPEVILYIRPGCHLCDEAHDILRRHGLRPRLVDIDRDAELQRRFDVCVPVVTIDGKERFRGRVNEVLLERLLQRRGSDAGGGSPTSPSQHLAIFARYWEPGKSKTRLASTLGDAAAAELSRCFLVHLLARFRSDFDVRTVVYSPDQRRAAFEEVCQDPAWGAGSWNLLPQGEGDLGEKLERFLRHTLSSGEGKVIVLGSDMPTIPRERVAEAWQALDDVPVVLGPAEDGGYYLLGVSGPVPPIFSGVDWGGPEVLVQTQRLLEQHRRPYHLLEPGYDIDRPEDLKRLLAELAAHPERDSVAMQLAPRIHTILQAGQEPTS